MADRACRPAISSRVENMADYDVIFVGFPVWWYREPSIIDTFMESYNFSGKTIVPFCTSGGSGLGDSSKNMQSLAKGSNVVDGKRLSVTASVNELKRWVDTII